MISYRCLYDWRRLFFLGISSFDCIICVFLSLVGLGECFFFLSLIILWLGLSILYLLGTNQDLPLGPITMEIVFVFQLGLVEVKVHEQYLWHLTTRY